MTGSGLNYDVQLHIGESIFPNVIAAPWIPDSRHAASGMTVKP
jgi:hypothetical protein